jgi:hypothetical protein
MVVMWFLALVPKLITTITMTITTSGAMREVSPTSSVVRVRLVRGGAIGRRGTRNRRIGRIRGLRVHP